MEIINNQKLITNSQLEEIVNLLGEDYMPLRITVFESATEAVEYNIEKFNIPEEEEAKEIYYNEQTVRYMILDDTIQIYPYYYKIKDKEEKQVNLIYDLVVELRRRYFFNEKIKGKSRESLQIRDMANIYRESVNELNITLIYMFASNFMNENADYLPIFMNWKNKWTYDE